MANLQEAQMPFIKNLASSDRNLRIASLDSLQTFLSSRRTLPTTDALKLWKGLYYALWMTDRPLPQQRLAADLAALIHRGVRPACTPAWLSAFWHVLGLQWTDIDALRMQKFLLLVRRVFAAQLAWCKERGFEGEDVRAVEAVMREWCFEEEGHDLKKVPVGLRLHVLDVWVDELEREGCLEDEGEAAQGFVKRIGAMVEVLKRSPVKSVRERAVETYADERLPWAKKGDEEDTEEDEPENDGDEDGWGGFDD